MPIVPRKEQEEFVRAKGEEIKSLYNPADLNERIVRQGAIQNAPHFQPIMAFSTTYEEAKDRLFELAKEMEDYVWGRGNHAAR